MGRSVTSLAQQVNRNSNGRVGGSLVAAVLVGVTLVGLPVAFVVAALYWLGLLLALPALSLVAGTEVARRVRRESIPAIGALLVGLIVLHLVTTLPVVGGLVTFLGLAFGLGLLVQSVRRWRQPLQPGRAPVPVPVAAPVAAPV